MMKPVVLTAHALVRLHDRNIDPKWIDETVHSPEWISADPRDPSIERRFRSIPQFNSRILRVAWVETNSEIRYKRDVRPERGAKAMTDITYAEADAVYITIGRGKVDRTDETGPFIYDVDADGQIVGIEILSAGKVLAPGDWKKAGPPKQAHASATE
jgi:uncharacterized protein YuzE